MLDAKNMWLPFPKLYEMSPRDEKDLHRFLSAEALFLDQSYRDPAADVNDTYLNYWRRVLQLAEPTGVFMELGVFQGTSISLISQVLLENKISSTVYGFDCFTGLPESWRELPEGTFSLESFPDVASSVELIDGLFSDTLPRFSRENDGNKISFLHMDADLYSSTMTAFKELYHMFKPGTIIAFDEFALWPGFYGKKQSEFEALLDASEAYGFKYEYVLRGWDATSDSLLVMKSDELRPAKEITGLGDGWQFTSSSEPKLSAREKAVIRITDV